MIQLFCNPGSFSISWLCAQPHKLVCYKPVSQASQPEVSLIISVIGQAAKHTSPDQRFRIGD